MLRLAALLALMVPAVAPAADDPQPAAPVSFRKQVAPILVKNCLGCHNAKEAKGGLNMATFALLKKGGKTYAAMILEPGDPDSSTLIELVRPDGEPRMPYKQPPLSDKDIQTLEQWVKQGAKFDAPSESDTQLASLVNPLENLPKIKLQAPATDPITAVAFSADGKTLAVAQGRSVLLFDPAGGKVVATLADHPGPVTGLRITPDGKTLVAAGGRPGLFGSLTFWDLATRKRSAEVKSHADSILAIDLSPDGKTLASASYDRLIKLWDVAKAAEIRTLKEHTEGVYSVAFAPDGGTLASAGADRTVKLWDVATGKRDQSLSDATAEVYAVAFGRDGKTVVAGGVDRSIRVWSWVDKHAKLEQAVVAHEGPIVRLALAPDGATLFSSGEDRAVKAWEYPGMKPRFALTGQADWALALALSPDGQRLAVGRYDGSLALLDASSGKQAVALREKPGTALQPSPAPAENAKPALVRNASLNPPSPRGAVRGSKVKLTLTGTSVGPASAVLFPEGALTAKILPAAKPDPNRLEVELEVASDARVGIHRFGVQTPLGVTPFQSFAVTAHPEANETEPNDDPGKLKPVALPATLLGTIERPGDVDLFRFDAKAGQDLVFDTTARSLGSSLNGTLVLLDQAGHRLAEASDSDTGPDPLLTYHVERDGLLVLQVLDADFGGSGNHFYRIQAGPTPYVAGVFPLGATRGETATITVDGLNLGGVKSVPVEVPAGAEPGTMISVPVRLADGSHPLQSRSIVAADGPQAVEAEPNDDPAKPTRVATPGGTSGRIDKDGDVDHFQFEAKKGQRLIVEVYGRRLGTPIDPVIEILDSQGLPIPRAVLRPVDETFVAFRDHPSSGRNIRLTQWDDLAVGDYLLIGHELTRLFALPRNPDDDAIFWGNGSERIGFLETTPEHHPMAQSIYKVEIHPPGTTFPPGGIPAVTLHYRNDDGGPGIGKDARVTFDPPADGNYVVRVEDVRGQGGPRYGYHLVVRRPRPDFRVALGTENANIPRGGSTLVDINLTRIDGFDGPVEVELKDLPEGIHATRAVIERDMYSAQLLMTADASAPANSPPTWKAVARAVTDKNAGSASSEELRHDLDPGGPQGGWVSVTPEPDLKVAASPDRVTIRPGQRIELKFAVDRKPPFQGRVPLQVENLPHGVRVLNIGLNGVLVTETHTERTVFLYAEPWAEPMERPFYVSGKLEVLGKAMGGTGAPVIDSSREQVSAPIELIVRPGRAGEQASLRRR